jgi:hypothetical protein
MDGEELELPYAAVVAPHAILGDVFTDTLVERHGQPYLSQDDEAIFDARVTRDNRKHEACYAMSFAKDYTTMYARTSCAGVKPAMKNLAVFLKYS